MKIFEVEVRRTSYITITVQAEDAYEATTRAWREIEESYDMGAADWQLESIEEIEE